MAKTRKKNLIPTCPKKPTLNRVKSQSLFNISAHTFKGASSGTERVHETAFSKKEKAPILFPLQNHEASQSLAILKLASGSNQPAIKSFSNTSTEAVLMPSSTSSCPNFTSPTVSKIPILKKVSPPKCTVSPKISMSRFLLPEASKFSFFHFI